MLSKLVQEAPFPLLLERIVLHATCMHNQPRTDAIELQFNEELTKKLDTARVEVNPLRSFESQFNCQNDGRVAIKISISSL